MKIAVQLYSLRHHMENGEDFLKILEKVKELGFDGVEFAGYWDYAPDVIKAKLDELGIVAVGTHMGYENYNDENLEKTLALGKALGLKTMGVGGFDLSSRENIDSFLSVMKKATPIAKEQGIKLYFHNHHKEFEIADENGTLLIDEIKAVTNLQVDTYWSFFAGVDNYKFLTENKDKIVHIHLKDGIDGHPVALTEGQCDLEKVVTAVNDMGLEWGILENDDPEPDGLSDIARSMKNFLIPKFK